MVIKEKKVQVEINGKVFRCSEHMLADMYRFGATQTKRAVKPAPKEVVMMMAPKKIILPVKEEVKEVIEEVKQEPLVELGIESKEVVNEAAEYPGDIPEIPTSVAKKRKPRVSSKSTK